MIFIRPASLSVATGDRSDRVRGNTYRMVVEISELQTPLAPKRLFSGFDGLIGHLMRLHNRAGAVRSASASRMERIHTARHGRC